MTSSILNQILHELGQQMLTHQVSGLHDSGVATFPNPRQPRTYGEFEQVVVAFIQHQFQASLRTTQAAPTLPYEMALARAHAMFPDWEQAARMAIHGVDGGIREIINTIWKKLKQEQEQQWIAYALDRIVPRLSWDSHVALAQEILDRFGQYLPPDVRAKPAAQLAANYRQIIMILTHAIRQIQTPLQAFNPHQN